MKYIVTTIGILVALAFMALSAAINWRYGATVGRDASDQWIYACVSLCADIAKATTPFFFWYALKHRNVLPALAAALFWLTCTAYSLSSAAGFAETSRSAQTGHLVNSKEAFDDLQKELARKQAQITALGAYEPPGVLASRIDALKQNPHWQTSKKCTDSTVPQSHQLCASIANAEAERQKGLQAAALETQVDTLRSRVAELAPASRIEGGDPRAGFIARLFGWDILKIQTGFALLFIVILELGSGLGLFIALSHGELSQSIKARQIPDAAAHKHAVSFPLFRRRRPEQIKLPPSPISASASNAIDQPPVTVSPQVFAPESPVAPVPAISGAAVLSESPQGDVAKFAVACLDHEHGGSVSFADLFAAYESWCAQRSLRPLSRAAFDTRFIALAASVDFHHEARGGERYCADFRLK